MNRSWRWMLPCYALLAVNAVFAVLYALIIARAHSWSWRDGVLTFVAARRKDGTTRLWGQPGAQGWSWIVGYADESQRNRADLRVHENTHVVQEFTFALGGLCIVPPVCVAIGLSPAWGLVLGGPLFGLAYGALFLAYYLTEQADERPGWQDDYRRNPFERHAYAVQASYSRGERSDAWGSR